MTIVNGKPVQKPIEIDEIFDEKSYLDANQM